MKIFVMNLQVRQINIKNRLVKIMVFALKWHTSILFFEYPFIVI